MTTPSDQIELDHADEDLPARAAYKASCDARGVRPTWGKSGFLSKIEFWRSIAAAAIDPTEPVQLRSRKAEPVPVEQNLDNISLTWNQTVSILRHFLGIQKNEESAFSGRMKHFQRLGYPCGNLGRGSKINLDRAKFLQIAFCSLLHHHGVPPLRSIAIVKTIWPILAPTTFEMLDGASEGADPAPTILTVYPDEIRSSEALPRVSLLPADIAITEFRSNMATSVQFIRIDIVLSDLLASLEACHPLYQRLT